MIKTIKTLIKVDTPTVNNRIYSREDINHICSLPIPEVGVLFNYKDGIDNINLMDISHKNLKVYLNEEDILVCDIMVLDTPKGKILKQMINDVGIESLFINICFLIDKDGIITKIHSLCIDKELG